MDIIPLKSWFEGSDAFPFIIAGPCSAESEEQVMSTASFVASTGRVSLFRAGVWKPRTRPGTFTGAGHRALHWLERVREELKIRVVVEVPVLIKNPLSPDIDLWQGAVERIYSAGVRRIAAVHRGFSPFERTLYRNMPKWEIPIELRQRITNLPVICDPSHMSGKAEYVPEIAQRALDLTGSTGQNSRETNEATI